MLLFLPQPSKHSVKVLCSLLVRKSTMHTIEKIYFTFDFKILLLLLDFGSQLEILAEIMS